MNSETNLMNWFEYAQMRYEESMFAFYQHIDMCTHCHGSGDHGYDEDCRPYICYGCGGTGKWNN